MDGIGILWEILKGCAGVFAFLGAKNKELGIGAKHHNAKFDIDERALALGVCATLQFVADFICSDTE